MISSGGAAAFLEALGFSGAETSGLRASCTELALSAVELQRLAELCILLDVLCESELTAEDIRVLAGYCFEEGQCGRTLRAVLQGAVGVLDGDLRDVVAKCGGPRKFGLLMQGFRLGLRFAAGDGALEDDKAG